MALRLLVVMAILQLALSAPDPDPGNNININVKIDVNEGGCCPKPNDCDTKKPCKDAGGKCQSRTGECDGVMIYGYKYCKKAYQCGCCISQDCVYDGKAYPIGAKMDASCFIIQCIKGGVWNYTGKINQTCGECQAYGDPQFITFDNHSDPGWSGYPRWYTYNAEGTFVITQIGLEEYADVYVTSVFEKEPAYGYSAARSVCYFEPDAEFCAYLPNLNLTHCYDTSDPNTYPECAIKVFVKGFQEDIVESVKMFNTLAGNVLVFKHNHTGILTDPYHQYYYNGTMNTECINIVGSTGLSISLCTSISGAGSDYSLYSHLYVWAMPHLKGNHLYGLCDTYTGTLRNGYTMHNGTLTNDTDAFVKTWDGVGDSTELPDVDKCTNATLLNEIDAQCANITADVCETIPPNKCAIFIGSCEYDLCRVSNRDAYLQGYANHFLIESHLNQ